MTISDREDRPAVVQGSDAPLFKGKGEEDFFCSCGHLLIEGYLARQFIGIGFVCYQCKALSLSKSWPAGEPFPGQMISLGRAGRFLLESTVDVTSNVGFTCEQEIDRVWSETGVREPDGKPMILSMEWLKEFQERLNIASEGEMDRCIQSTLKARASGNRRYLKYPPAWAIIHLRDCIGEGRLSLDSQESCAAMAYILVLKHLVARWQHHPLFSLMSKGLVLEYPHTITQLIAASHLADHGNRVGFTDLATVEGRSPDLFINLDFLEKVSVEIKAPSELQWPNECPSDSRLEKIVLKQIQKAKGQLTGELGGIIVLGASWLSRGSERSFESVVRDLIKRGKISSKVSGIAGVCIYLADARFDVDVDKIASLFSAWVFMCPNSQFKGPAYLQIESNGNGF